MMTRYGQDVFRSVKIGNILPLLGVLKPFFSLDYFPLIYDFVRL